MWAVECADVLEWAAGYEGEPFSAILCDPPYEMSFMSKKWDGTGISFQSETWAALSQHLLPGGFVFAFAGARTYHRLACAMEDAGLRLFPCLGWLYGSGFPKATRIDSQIDKAAGKLKEREVIGEYQYPDGKPRNTKTHKTKRSGIYSDIKTDDSPNDRSITVAATPLARTWAGHHYGLQCIKPALELIAVAQKPYQGRPVDSITATGAGAMWIDGGRITGVTRDPRKAEGSLGGHSFHGYEYDGRPKEWNATQGRWPANFALVHNAPRPCPTCDGDGCDSCSGTGLVGGCRRVGMKRVKASRGGKVGGGAAFGKEHQSVIREETKYFADSDGYEETAAWDCEAGCAVREIGEQSGEIDASYRGGDRAQKKPNRLYNVYPTRDDGWSYKGVGYTDKGTCARFFFNADWHYEIAERLAAATPVRYQAKASRKERDVGLEGMLLMPPPASGRSKPAEGRKNALGEPRRNGHPTVKPIALCRWLATLLLPPPEYAPRRILIPFAGSGSECIAAGLAGWEFVLGIEREQEYCAIAEARLAHWLDGPRQLEMEVGG